MNSLWRDWAKLKRNVQSRKKKLLLLDFDGTLAPIALHPEHVVLEEITQKALACLARSRHFEIVIISGRSLKDLKSYFPLKNIIYVGNHGFEMKGKGFSTPSILLRKAKKARALIDLLTIRLQDSLEEIPGVWIENKRYTLSLHFRDLTTTYLSLFQEKLKFLKKKCSDLPIVWRRGKKVWDLRLDIPWGKGEASLFLSRRFPRALPIAIGDDYTDEDMFESLRSRGITIRVGFRKHSLAKYYVKSPREVTRLLQELHH
jgi:trehalose-phosphatase